MFNPGETSELHSQEPRVIEACVKIMQNQGLIGKLVPRSTPQGMASQIYKHIENQRFDSKTKKSFINNLIKEAKQRLIPLEELEWIRTNPRACYLAYGRIFIFPDESLAGNNNLSSYCLNQVSRPSNTEERYKNLVIFFDKCTTAINRRLLISNLKSEWERVFNERIPFSWLSKSHKEQCDWAWDYISKYYYGPPINYFSVTSLQEQYLAIYAAYDLWNAPYAEKKLFLQNFTKAWQQKKHRDSRKGKKVCNLVLSEEVKSKLDIMAEKKNMKLNKFVEMLIENEFSKY
ncbi:hypothetical protein [Vibrio diazotrophicus]|uniref:hypothetical protein n=1 Tax=Vibrio diazotrophicus TaxID=685 RepID=UPI00142DA35A|nr:hypothetical protein [Vibrio diazotrophicus]NIY91536.1 hypothetical protein [Vibrio diazotrophicus]